MKKIAYRFVFFLLALSLIASPAFADDLYDKHTPDRNDPERLQQIQRIIAETNDAINNSYIPHSAGLKNLKCTTLQTGKQLLLRTGQRADGTKVLWVYCHTKQVE